MTLKCFTDNNDELLRDSSFLFICFFRRCTKKLVPDNAQYIFVPIVDVCTSTRFLIKHSHLFTLYFLKFFKEIFFF